jgi:hypothetical protein
VGLGAGVTVAVGSGVAVPGRRMSFVSWHPASDKASKPRINGERRRLV